jgi:hypothetical protein
MQRMLLRRMAAYEVQQAELARKQQEHPTPPHGGWSIARLFRELARDELPDRLVEPQLRRHERQRQEWLDLNERVLAGDEHAKALFNLKMMGMQAAGEPPPGMKEEFTPVIPETYWDRSNSSRVMRGLIARQLVYRRAFAQRWEAWVLTREGFVEARRLGDVASSEVVDLDLLQERWCETARLPFHQAVTWYSDDIAA